MCVAVISMEGTAQAVNRCSAGVDEGQWICTCISGSGPTMPNVGEQNHDVALVDIAVVDIELVNKPTSVSTLDRRRCGYWEADTTIIHWDRSSLLVEEGDQ